MFFPEVYLLVGVNSDELVRKHKSIPVMTSQERYESVRNCKWADEVIYGKLCFSVQSDLCDVIVGYRRCALGY